MSRFSSVLIAMCLCLLTSLVHAQTPNDPEEIFRKASARVHEAKTYRFVGKLQIKVPLDWKAAMQATKSKAAIAEIGGARIAVVAVDRGDLTHARDALLVLRAEVGVGAIGVDDAAHS